MSVADMGKSLEKLDEVMDMAALAAFIRHTMEKLKLSTYDVARRATSAGPEYEIAHTTVWGVMHGKFKYAYPSTMKALAQGLGVTEKELWDVAQGRAEPLPGYILEPRSLTLPDSTWSLIEQGAKRTRRSVEQYVEALAEAAAGGNVNIELRDRVLTGHAPPPRKRKAAASTKSRKRR